jgi:hypothetical protein
VYLLIVLNIGSSCFPVHRKQTEVVMVALDEEEAHASTAPLIVGARHSTGFSDSKGLTTSKYGAAEVDRSIAEVPAESSRSSINTSRGGKLTESAILHTH